MKREYIVIRDHTLAYVIGSQSAGVLSSSVHDPKCGPISYFERDARPATTEDFSKFRVSPIGHIS